MPPFTPYDENTSKSTVATLCALLDMFELPGQDSVLEWEARIVLYDLSEQEREIIRRFAEQTSKAIRRYLSVEEVAAMFATKPKVIRQLARRGEICAVWRANKLYFSPEAINDYVSTHTFRGKARNPSADPAL